MQFIVILRDFTIVRFPGTTSSLHCRVSTPFPCVGMHSEIHCNWEKISRSRPRERLSSFRRYLNAAIQGLNSFRILAQKRPGAPSLPTIMGEMSNLLIIIWIYSFSKSLSKTYFLKFLKIPVRNTFWTKKNSKNDSISRFDKTKLQFTDVSISRFDKTK